MRRKIAVAGVALASLGVLALGQSAAFADGGSWHAISGTAYESGAWFESSNVRTVGPSASSISVTFGQTPTNGLAFNVIDYQTGMWHGIIYAPPTGNQELSAGDVWNGKQFVNNYKLQNPGHQSNYSFSGSENY